ncbi:MAG: D-alanyl-D-alanine carboxypeptidase family protein [Lachnospiraceae bacterium]|nr:D-alanyl-D-alanine carboxypeptidase [Clostridiales bacterium]MDY3110580.1 D-alanyl-D-alanine carboxypeptidase family protein [Lachnospiraceae bacterium]
MIDKRSNKKRTIASKLLSIVLSFLSIFSLCFISCIPVHAAPDITSPSYIVMEASTGRVICEENANEKRSPASITKIMTLLVTFDQIEKGRVHLTDQVVTSAYAKSMGGSQVFLEEGEIQSLETLIKCIAIASGNDASVAVAEHVAGSEPEFVRMMNDRAEQLGLTGTHFLDCCGLSDSDEHYTTAADVAKMSRELITKYPQVLDYTGIWMEDITHVTNKGSETFTLSSTNKLLKLYNWTTGLKTGSTSKAMYCLSATAKKDDLEMIAVVLGAPTNKARFNDAMALLSYGYSVSRLYEDSNQDTLPNLPVKGGVQDYLRLAYGDTFRYVDVDGNDLSLIEKELVLEPEVVAPIEEGQAVGEMVYKLKGTRIGSVSIQAAQAVPKATYMDCLLRLGDRLLFGVV